MPERLPDLSVWKSLIGVRHRISHSILRIVLIFQCVESETVKILTALTVKLQKRLLSPISIHIFTSLIQNCPSESSEHSSAVFTHACFPHPEMHFVYIVLFWRPTVAFLRKLFLKIFRTVARYQILPCRPNRYDIHIHPAVEKLHSSRNNRCHCSWHPGKILCERRCGCTKSLSE